MKEKKRKIYKKYLIFFKNLKLYIRQDIIKSIKRTFKRTSNIKKFFILFSIILIIDIININIDIISSNSNYKEQMKKFADNNESKLMKYVNEDNLLPIEQIIKPNIISNISKVEIRTSNGGLFTSANIITQKNKIFNSTSMSTVIFNKKMIPIFDEHNISYFWSFKSKYELPEKNKVEYFKITSFLIRHIFEIFMIFIIIYLLKFFVIPKKIKKINPEDISYGFNNLIGMENIKEEIIQLKDLLNNREKYAKYGLSKTFNILFSGPPGVGKTKIAKGMSKELGIPMIFGTGNVETGLVAGGSNTIKGLFERAKEIATEHKSLSCIIFLDEAQVLLRKRENSINNPYSNDANNQLLDELDGIKVSDEEDINIIFIAASNFDDSNMTMDEAMERRFKKKIYFELPNESDRKKLFEFFLKKIDISVKEENIDTKYLAKITSKMSPAKIKTIVEEASLFAIRKNVHVSTAIISKSFERITVGETSRKQTEGKEQARKVIIYHELGHFFTEFDAVKNKIGSDDISKIKENMNFLKISSESISKYNILGFVMSSKDDSLLKTRKDMENDIVSLYGGLSAEIHFLNNGNEETDNITTGSYNDIDKVSEILYHMIYELGMYSNKKINYKLLKIDDDEMKKQLDKKAEMLFKKSLIIISEYEEIIEYMFKIIEEKWTLDKEEMFSYISNFYSSKN